MPKEPLDIGTALSNRLKKFGIETDFIPGLLKDIYDSFYLDPGINREKINHKLHDLGWTEVELDHLTFALAEANLLGYAKTVSR
jgi:hypothetical protein